MENTKNNKFYSLLIFSLVLLINPNINVVDIMPDFIGWFILARLFERAADQAPYFEEARAAFVKLAWLTAAKIPAFLLILLVRNLDTSDSNIFALTSIVFAIGETVLLVSAAKNIYQALFHLGERTDAVSLISPIKSRTKKLPPLQTDAIKEFTYFFFILKCIIYVLPDMFLLTRVSDRGTVLTTSRYYPIVLLLTQLVGICIGILWFIRVRKYALAVHTEGKFFDALESMASESFAKRFEINKKLRSVRFILFMSCLSTFFTIELAFDNWNGVNILPHFIYGFLLLFVFHKLSAHTKTNPITYLFGALFCTVSIIFYVFYIRFFSLYDYQDLADSAAARRAYITLEAFGVLEFILLAVFLFFIARAFNSFVLSNTGLSPDSDRYNRTEMEYHKTLIKRNYIIMSFGILAGLLKCFNLFVGGDVQLIFSDITDVTMPVITASALPWFDLVVFIFAVLYIGVNWYYISSLREEVELKYK